MDSIQIPLALALAYAIQYNELNTQDFSNGAYSDVL